MIAEATAEKFRVLVIDDNAAIHSDILKILRAKVGELRDDASYGIDELEAKLFGSSSNSTVTLPEFEIDSAYQGKEGLELVRKAQAESNPYTVAFIDMRMPPGWDGVQTAEKLWEVDPRLQLVLSTAYTDYSWTEIVDRLGQSSSLLYIKKPFEPIEIQQLVLSLSVRRREDQHRQKHIQELQDIAKRDAETISRDGQTGLYTKEEMCRLLHEEVRQYRRHNMAFALLLIGIDDIENVIDWHGEPIANALIAKVAKKLQVLVRPTDLLSRYDHTTLAVTAPFLKDTHARDSGERIRQVISQRAFTIYDEHRVKHQLSISVSVGVAGFPYNADSDQELIQAAEAALRDARTNGNRTVSCGDDINE